MSSDQQGDEVCNICKRRFTTVQQLEHHKKILAHHDPPPAASTASSDAAASTSGGGDYTCQFCDEVCSSDAALKNHENECKIALEIVASRNASPTLTKKKVKTVRTSTSTSCTPGSVNMALALN